MTELTLANASWMLLMVAIASFAGLSIARLLPWSATSRQAGIPCAFGLALAPFLASFAAVLALGLLAGAQHNTHLCFVLLLLLAVGALCWLMSAPSLRLYQPNPTPNSGWHYWLLSLLLIAWCVSLLVNALCLPLTQNDPLEYATVGRLLFELRDLRAYPAIDPTRGSSGFYGPWTHPPLYPACIYLTSILQGHADSSGLMRLIAPWYALTTTLLIYALGNRASRMAGLLAALTFISVPLLFFGADAGSIDALPILGFTLILTTIIAIKGSATLRGVVQGIVLGMALWTHSQAILFIPLTLVMVTFYVGWQAWRKLAQQIIILLIVAALLATWPYTRNLLLYGKLISDTHTIYALPELAWADYFTINRGINFWTAKIQYGLFKGWFCFEAYSLSFWLMGIGSILYLKQVFHRCSWRQCLRGNFNTVPMRWLCLTLISITCYLGIVLMSMMIGHNEIIRNERYWLVQIPCVSLVAGWGLNCFFNAQSLNIAIKKQFKVSLSQSLTILLFTVPLIIFNIYRWSPYLKKEISINQADIKKIEQFLTKKQQPYQIDLLEKPLFMGSKYKAHWSETPWQRKLLQTPSLLVARYLQKNTPKEAVVLSLKPSDMYYAERRMVNFHDPILTAFYVQKDVQKAWTILRDLGVDYVHIPDYCLPPFYNTVLPQILALPELSTLLFSKAGYQIYRLRRVPGAKRRSTEQINLTPGQIPWTVSTQTALGGRKKLLNIASKQMVTMHNKVFDACLAIPLFQRDWTTLLLSGIGDSNNKLVKSYVPVTSNQEYRLDTKLTGKAHVQLYLESFDKQGTLLETALLGDVILGTVYPKRYFSRRFKTCHATKYIRIGIKKHGQSTLYIDNITLTKLATQNVH